MKWGDLRLRKKGWLENQIGVSYNDYSDDLSCDDSYSLEKRVNNYFERLEKEHEEKTSKIKDSTRKEIANNRFDIAMNKRQILLEYIYTEFTRLSEDSEIYERELKYARKRERYYNKVNTNLRKRNHILEERTK